MLKAVSKGNWHADDADFTDLRRFYSAENQQIRNFKKFFICENQ